MLLRQGLEVAEIRRLYSILSEWRFEKVFQKKVDSTNSFETTIYKLDWN